MTEPRKLDALPPIGETRNRPIDANLPGDPTCEACGGDTWILVDGEDPRRCDACHNKRRRDALRRYDQMGENTHYFALEPLRERVRAADLKRLAPALEALQKVHRGEARAAMLMGDPGTGKTMCAARSAVCFDNAGVLRLWIYWSLAVERLRNFDVPDSHPDSSASWLRRLISIPVLFIDDLGAERLTPFAEEKLLQVIHERDESTTARTVITTNFTDDLPDRVGLRVTSRLMGMCEVVELAGVDQRMTSNHKTGDPA